MGVFKQLNEQGKTIIIVTHDMGVAQQCDRIIEISDGSWTIVDKQERCFDALFFDFETEYNMVVHGIYSLKTRLKTYMHDYSKTDVKFSSNVIC